MMSLVLDILFLLLLVIGGIIMPLYAKITGQLEPYIIVIGFCSVLVCIIYFCGLRSLSIWSSDYGGI